MRFTGIGLPEEFRTVTRAHIIAWRDELARAYSAQLGFEVGAHALRATAPPMRSITRPTSPRFSNGSATRIFPPRVSMITGERGRKTARLSRWRIDMATRPEANRT